MLDAAAPAGHVQSVSVVHEALRQNPPEQTSPLAQFAFDPQVPLQLFGAPPTGAEEGEGLGEGDGDGDADGEGETDGDGLGDADGLGEGDVTLPLTVNVSSTGLPGRVSVCAFG
ncbi:MAG: hypothetical protein G01um10145_335 [Microgenomates group bacterium Gr01-1014_5]|nr:MAG: hypothetical protein G01um10145_335 [Microgenomates group bacterium Gr01-1014_5]